MGLMPRAPRRRAAAVLAQGGLHLPRQPAPAASTPTRAPSRSSTARPASRPRSSTRRRSPRSAPPRYRRWRPGCWPARTRATLAILGAGVQAAAHLQRAAARARLRARPRLLAHRRAHGPRRSACGVEVAAERPRTRCAAPTSWSPPPTRASRCSSARGWPTARTSTRSAPARRRRASSTPRRSPPRAVLRQPRVARARGGRVPPRRRGGADRRGARPRRARRGAAGLHPGRTSPSEITLFARSASGIEDMAAAEHAVAMPGGSGSAPRWSCDRDRGDRGRARADRRRGRAHAAGAAAGRRPTAEI